MKKLHTTPSAVRLVALLVALVAAFVRAPVATAADAKATRSVQERLEAKANELLAQRIDPRRYVVYAKVEASAPQTTDGKPVRLPFVPVDINPEIITALLASGDDDKALRQLSFTLTLIVDESVDQQVVATLGGVLKDRFEIDDTARKLVVRSAKLTAPEAVTPSASADLQAERQKLELETARARLEGEAARARMEADAGRTRLEAEAARARLESERTRLELNKREIEYNRSLAALESNLRDEKDKAEKKAAAAVATPAGEPVKERGFLDVVSSLQLLILGVLGLIAAVMTGLLFGGSLRNAMGMIGEGIRAAGSGIGSAMTVNREAAEEPTRVSAEAAAAEEAARRSEEAARDASDWKPGNKEHDAFVLEVQDKIAVLSREGSSALRQALVDMFEQESGVATAAAVVLALSPATARLLIDDLPTETVRKLKTFLETPAATARAKMMRQTALQDFYGRIAAVEFADSPLGRLKNMGWLTRMSSAEMMRFALSLPAQERPVFLACLSPYRIAKLIEQAVQARDKATLLAAVSGIGRVSEDEVRKFVSDRERAAALAAQAAKAKPAVDQLHYLEQVAKALSPEDQQALLKAVSSQDAVVDHLSRRMLPFNAIMAVPGDVLSELLDKRSAAQIATIMFAAEEPVREQMFGALPAVKAETTREELGFMLEKTSSTKKFMAASAKAQREVANQLLRLASDGALDIEQLIAASGLRGAKAASQANASQVPVPLSKTNEVASKTDDVA